MELLKWTLYFLLLAAAICRTDAAERCETSSKVATFGESYQMKLDLSQCPDCRLMLEKDGKEFYFWNKNAHWPACEDLDTAECERLKNRLSDSTPTDDQLILTFSSVERGDKGRYCLKNLRTCLHCFNLEVGDGSSSDKINQDDTKRNSADRNKATAGAGAALVAVIIRLYRLI